MPSNQNIPNFFIGPKTRYQILEESYKHSSCSSDAVLDILNQIYTNADKQSCLNDCKAFINSLDNTNAIVQAIIMGIEEKFGIVLADDFLGKQCEAEVYSDSEDSASDVESDPEEHPKPSIRSSR